MLVAARNGLYSKKGCKMSVQSGVVLVTSYMETNVWAVGGNGLRNAPAYRSSLMCALPESIESYTMLKALECLFSVVGEQTTRNGTRGIPIITN